MAGHPIRSNPTAAIGNRLAEVECPEPVEGHSFVYILESQDSALYIGQSTNVPERLRKHRYGLGSKHTHDHPEVRLVYFDGPMSVTSAVRRERQLKGWSRAKKEALITGNLDQLRSLSRAHR